MSQKKFKKYQKKGRRRDSKWLPILIVLGGLLVVALAFLALREKSIVGSETDTTGTPILKVDREKVDLGDVKLNQPVQVSFQITNEGDAPLRFLKEPYIEVAEGC